MPTRTRSTRRTTPAVLPPSLQLARNVRVAPSSTSGLAQQEMLWSALKTDCATRTSPLLGRDGLTANSLPLMWTPGRGRTFETVAAAIRQQIADERTAETDVAGNPTSDSTVQWQTLRLHHLDGAMMRLGGAGVPVTEHALGQAVSALTAGGTGPRSGAANLAWQSTMARAIVWLELLATAKRDPTQPLLVRTGYRLRQGLRFNNAPARERVIRAVMTSRSSGIHFDDPALLRVLESVTPAGNFALFERAALGTESRFRVEVADRLTKGGLDLSVSGRNSETGEARLAFAASARIRALDAVVVAHRGVAVLDEADVELASSRGSSERNHTLPTISTAALRETYGLKGNNGDRLTEPQRASIAAQRMAASFKAASEAAVELGRQWDVALKTFAPGCDAFGASGLTAEVQAQVVLDLCEEHGMVLGADRAGIEQVLIDDSRLMSLPHGSAAHMAAAFAVLAARGTATVSEVEGKKVTTFAPRAWGEAHRLQQVAGRWVACGWDRKAHRAAMQESGED